MRDGTAANARVRMTEAPELVVRVLEEIRVDRAEPQAELLRPHTQVVQVVDPVPREVQRDRPRDPGQPVHLGRVLELLERVSRHAGLREHGEAGPGVAERPRRRLDLLGAQRRLDPGDVVTTRLELCDEQVVCSSHPVRTSDSSRAQKRPYRPLQRSGAESGS